MGKMSIIAQPKNWSLLTVLGAEGVSIKIINADKPKKRVVLMANAPRCVSAGLFERTPMRRFADPSEIADGVLFLSSG